MVSGKPPRHSKSKAEPVTIDLDAKDVTDVSKGGEPTAADAPAKTSPVDAKPALAADPIKDSVKKDETPKPIWDQPVKPPIEPEPNVSATEDVKPAATAAASSGPEKLSATLPPKPASTENKADPLKSAAPKTDIPKSDPLKTEPPKTQTSVPPSSARSSASASAGSATSNEKKSAGNSGLIAAGIVGGLIALLAAGSMQYAGYLPPFSSGGGSSDELNALKSQVANLQQQVASAPQAAGDTSALEQRIATLESSTSSSGDLSGKVTQLESTVAALQSERSAQDEKTAELTRRLTDAETKINEPRDDIEVARAIASAGLKAAIDRGGPFLTELDTLSRVTPDDPSIQSLRPFANTGVPSRAELTRNFPDVANAMLDSLRQSDPNQSIVDRLAESAMSLVKVRPVGNVEGEGAEAKIARMEDKLRNGDLKGAALEWDGLPEPAKTASADYKKSLDARIQVEDLVNSTLTRAITTTGQQG